jgi:hypothetical protein
MLLLLPAVSQTLNLQLVAIIKLLAKLLGLLFDHCYDDLLLCSVCHFFFKLGVANPAGT